MPNDLFEIAEKENVLVDFVELPWDILGVYYYVEPDPPVILLHKKTEHRRRLLRCVLAEELGHHFTTAFDLIAFARSNKAYMARKYEKKAILWAVEYLIPLDKLVAAVNSGLFLTHELAEYFDVTCRFMGTGINLYYEKLGSSFISKF
jgi:Zn-dependent peptidase ImmA (M78 family)